MLKKLLVRAGVVASGVMLSGAAMATSVLDAATKTAITTGFTDVKDTALDVVASSFPFLLGIAAVMFGPKIVKRIVHMF